METFKKRIFDFYQKMEEYLESLNANKKTMNRDLEDFVETVENALTDFAEKKEELLKQMNSDETNRAEAIKKNKNLVGRIQNFKHENLKKINKINEEASKDQDQDRDGDEDEDATEEFKNKMQMNFYLKTVRPFKSLR